MDTVKSINKGYGKVDETQDLALKRKTRKRLYQIGISVAVLVAIIISSTVTIAIHSRKGNSPHPTPSSVPELTPAASLKTVCSVTNYPVSCFSSISKLPLSNTTDPEVIFRLSLQVVIDELNSIVELPKKLAEETDDEGLKSALSVCEHLLDLAIDRVNETVSAMEVVDGKKILNAATIDDLLTWLSAAVTYHGTCLDALDEISHTNSAIPLKLKSGMVNSTEFTSNSLAIVAKILSTISDFGIPIHGRRLLNSSPHATPISVPKLTPAASLRNVCSVTRYPASCVSSISKLPSSNTTDPEALFRLSLQVVINELNSIAGLPKKLAEETDDERLKSSLSVCGDVFYDAIDIVNDTISTMEEVGDGKKILKSSTIDEIQTWLSTAVTDHDTCLDALDELSQNKTEYANSPISLKLKSAMVNSRKFTSNSLAIIAKFPIHERHGVQSPRLRKSPHPTPSSVLRTVCNVTNYPASCISSISKLPLSKTTTDPKVLFRLSLQVTFDELNSIVGLPKKLAEETNDEGLKSALSVCADVFDLAVDSVNDTISSLDEVISGGKKNLNSSTIGDLITWLSSAVTDIGTCGDTLDEDNYNSPIPQKLKSAMVNSTEFTSNSLAIVAQVLKKPSKSRIPVQGRRLLNSNSFPNWVRPGVRRLLQVKNLTPHVTVAADGSGDVRTVNEAVWRVPKKGKTMFVIYVKAGTYVENVLMKKDKWNVFIYGDGRDKTIISGSTNMVDGVRTFNTSTFATEGKGFMMKDMGIINTAGPEKHQAVAFRSDSDRSVYYRCSFDGYQDTLYTHSNRQYYRNCDVTGTVDFIFGAGTVVFQGCSIRPRQPLPNQFNTITAEGTQEANQNTGISIHQCTISPNGNVTATTYLGRPWKLFSKTVIMQSVIGSFVNPAGWIAWNSTYDPPPRTIFYREYKNSGPGSDLSKRVKWAGYKPISSDDEAARFTVKYFLRGDDNWIPKAVMGMPPL
ncbi:unnamed protein product [Arabidopsis thaliana]|uniref:pectinesterase n=1 Tax=Arabidopsis thaliana TaxID=3702 RepID=A0A654F732_ARATH|nr:unnamed protein product [Arabidopsis thaliana]